MSKSKSKSQLRREAIQNGEPAETAENKGAEAETKTEDKEVKPVDVKYRVTFLTNQMFIGLFRPKGTSAIVSGVIAKAYGNRTTLKFEEIA